MSTDVIVVGHRYVNSAGIVVTQFNFYTDSGDPERAYQAEQNTNPGEVFINVNVRIANSSNSEKAQQAAANVAAAVATIIAAAQSLPSSTPISLPNNQLTSLGNLVSNLQSTTFLITDSIIYNNRGVGGADHQTMTDQLYFASFVDGSGQLSYTEQRFNGQGLIGTVLHELGHLSIEGYNNLNDEITMYNHETAVLKVPQDQRNFYTSSSGRDYARDVESYAQAYALSAASVLGLDISTYDSILRNGGDVTDFVGPQEIYNEHMSDFDG